MGPRTALRQPPGDHPPQLPAGRHPARPLRRRALPRRRRRRRCPAENTTADIEAFQAGIIETRSASTAVNKHKCLHQFFKWLMLDEEEIDRSPQ
ncbi:phage integrase N-terminal SAM-like domain-containing protein [Saccharopolyspora sp. 6V]|nr:phage integrase N-terminal SAM-like domain-containing protein [Saccharopolyspora sp. 6V]MCA1194148.1 phage integrase N-terminal SAM-like domain-containing protein [Saccharopolyspora sp. 6V]